MTARARGTRNRQDAHRAEERALIELLSHGLSEEEIQRVLARALLALDERGRDRLLAQLGEETGGTLRRLLASRRRSRTTAQPSPGSAKIREEWEKAWDKWEGLRRGVGARGWPVRRSRAPLGGAVSGRV